MIRNQTRTRANNDIRLYAKEKGILLWEVADRLHIADTSLSRYLRRELAEDEKEEIFKVIESLATERGSHEEE